MTFHICSGTAQGEKFEHVFDVESPDINAQEAGQRVLMHLCVAAGLPGIDDTAELHNKILTATVKSNRRIAYEPWGAQREDAA